LIHVTDEEKLLEVLQRFFKKCLQHGLFLHAVKCNLFGTEVRYCGRIITAEGVRYDRASCIRRSKWVRLRMEVTWYSMWLL
jgi:hypothetical protein